MKAGKRQVKGVGALSQSPIPSFQAGTQKRKRGPLWRSLQRACAPEEGSTRAETPEGKEPAGDRGSEQGRETQEMNPQQDWVLLCNNGKPWRILDMGVKGPG